MRSDDPWLILLQTSLHLYICNRKELKDPVGGLRVRSKDSLEQGCDPLIRVMTPKRSQGGSALLGLDAEKAADIGSERTVRNMACPLLCPLCHIPSPVQQPLTGHLLPASLILASALE